MAYFIIFIFLIITKFESSNHVFVSVIAIINIIASSNHMAYCFYY